MWAATWQNKQNDCVPSEDSDQPGHPPSLIRVFAVRLKKPWVLSYPLNAQLRHWSDWAHAQADLSLRWAHTHFVGFVMSWLMWCFQTSFILISVHLISRARAQQNQLNSLVPSEGHLPSLISVFTVCMKKPWVLGGQSAQQRLIRLGGCPGWSESLLGAQVILLICHAPAHL